MSAALYDDVNPDWEGGHPVAGFDIGPGWEPWEPEDDEDYGRHEGGCAYCDATEVRDRPEPFGGKPCCEACFNILIGGDADDPPWRCPVTGL